MLGCCKPSITIGHGGYLHSSKDSRFTVLVKVMHEKEIHKWFVTMMIVIPI